jgi:hypothetical protein
MGMGLTFWGLALLDRTISNAHIHSKRPKFPSCVIESVEQVSTYFVAVEKLSTVSAFST